MPDHSLAEEPTTNIIDRNFRRLAEIWSGAKRQWEKYDSYYFRTYAVWESVEAAKRPDWLRPARPTSIVDSAVDHQLSSQPIYHRWPTGEGDAKQKAADRVEVALGVMSEEQALLEPMLTWKTVGKNLTHLGYAVLETGLDTTILQKRREEPERLPDMDDDEWKAVERLYKNYRRTAMPFRARVPHPARVLMDPWEKRPRLAVRTFQKWAVDLEDLVRSRKFLNKKTGDFQVRNNDPFERFMVTEWWTDYYHALMLTAVFNGKGSTGFYSYNSNQRRLLFVDRNTWGFVPFSHAFAGFGQEPTTETRIDPKHLAVGLLAPVMADIRAQAQQMNSRHNAVIEASWLPVATSQLSADELRDQLDQGDIVEAPQGSIWRMEPPKHPRWLFQHGQELEEDIEDGTFSRILGGRKAPGQNTVGQTQIFTDAAGRKFVALAKQMEHLASVNGSHQLQLIDLLDLDLTVRGKRIKASDLDSDYTITATFDVVDPFVQLQNKQIGLQEIAAGVKSLKSYLVEDARKENVSDETHELILDAVRRSPLIHQELMIQASEELGVGELMREAIEREKEAQAGGNRNGARNGTGEAPIPVEP